MRKTAQPKCLSIAEHRARYLAELDEITEDYVEIRRDLAESSATLDRLEVDLREIRRELEWRAAMAKHDADLADAGRRIDRLEKKIAKDDARLDAIEAEMAKNRRRGAA